MVALAAHGFDLALLPAVGGSVAWLNWTGPDGRTVPLLRPSDADAIAPGNPSRLACFPLVPFANRIAGSRFVFGGREHRLPVNRPPDPMAIHGFGFQAAWAAEAIGEARSGSRTITRRPDRRSATGPNSRSGSSPGRAHRACGDARGQRAMPYGIGLHPWLPRPPDTRLRFTATHVFVPDDTKLPRDRSGRPGARFPAPAAPPRPRRPTPASPDGRPSRRPLAGTARGVASAPTARSAPCTCSCRPTATCFAPSRCPTSRTCTTARTGPRSDRCARSGRARPCGAR